MGAAGKPARGVGPEELGKNSCRRQARIRARGDAGGVANLAAARIAAAWDHRTRRKTCPFIALRAGPRRFHRGNLFHRWALPCARE